MNFKRFFAYSILLLFALQFSMMFVAAVETKSAEQYRNAPDSIDPYEHVFGAWASKVFPYIFGKVTELTANDISNIIIAVAIWAFILVTFGDIISAFSSFSKQISWIVAFLVALISANMGWSNFMLKYTISGFAFLGAFAVAFGLLASFVAFFGLNWGLMSLGSWLNRRKSMIEANNYIDKSRMAVARAGVGVDVAREMAEAARKEEKHSS
jgi:hypothetical protein